MSEDDYRLQKMEDGVRSLHHFLSLVVSDYVVDSKVGNEDCNSQLAPE